MSEPRVFRPGDPEPADHPPVVDNNGSTWEWDVEEQWRRNAMVRYSNGFATRGPIDFSWDELLGEYGPLTEADEEQAKTWTEVISSL